MTHFRACARAAMLLACLLVAAPGPASAQDEPITAATPDIIRLSREDAARARQTAGEDLARARQWRELEANARRNAAGSQDPKDAQSWLGSAAQYDKYAKDIEDHVEKLRAQADAAESRANRLDTALAAARPKAPAAQPAPPAPAASGAGQPDPTAMRVEDVVGYWETSEGPNLAFALVAERGGDGKLTNRLVAHTRKRQWRGEFALATSGSVVKLTYSPRPEEMNPEIPEWARRAAEGRLVWRIELTPQGESYDFTFKAKWFAGEVKWNPASTDPKSVEVADEKSPYEFELELNYAIAIEALEFPSLSLVAKGIEYDADAYPIDALTMGQLFSPRLVVPAQMAKTLGETITVSVKAAKSGGSESVELKKRNRPGSGPVTYLPDQPVMIADDCLAIGAARRNPPLLSVPWMRRKIGGEKAETGDFFWTWIAGDDPGPCLQLAAEDGELIEIRYSENFIVVPLYSSWVQHGLARHKVMLARLRAAFRSVATGQAGGGDPEAARKRLRMLDNYEKLIASDQLTDIYRFNLGELYLGDSPTALAIVLMTDGELSEKSREHRPERAGPGFANPVMRAFLDGLSGTNPASPIKSVDGVQWASPGEEFFVREALVNTRDETESDRVKEYVKNLTFGGYEALVALGGRSAWIVATGTDHHGTGVSGWERFFTAVNLASTAVLTIAGAELQVQELFRASSWGSTMGAGLRTESTLLSSASRTVDEAAQGASFPGLPQSVSAAEREQLILTAVADAARAGKPAACARLEGAASVSTLMDVRRAPGNTLSAADQAGREAYVRRSYGPGARLRDAWSGKPARLFKQVALMCQAEAANRLIFNAKGLVRTPAETMHRMNRIMLEQVEEFDMQPGGVSFGKRARQGTRKVSDFANAPGIKDGYDSLAVRDYLRAEGAKVSEILPAKNYRVRLRHIWSALQKGYGVKVVVDFAKMTGENRLDLRHAISVEEVVGTTSGGRAYMTEIVVYDSNVADFVVVPARDFDRLLARDWKDEGILTVVRFSAP